MLLDRREFLKTSLLAGGAFLLEGCGLIKNKTYPTVDSKVAIGVGDSSNYYYTDSHAVMYSPKDGIVSILGMSRPLYQQLDDKEFVKLSLAHFVCKRKDKYTLLREKGHYEINDIVDRPQTKGFTIDARQALKEQSRPKGAVTIFNFLENGQIGSERFLIFGYRGTPVDYTSPDGVFFHSTQKLLEDNISLSSLSVKIHDTNLGPFAYLFETY